MPFQNIKFRPGIVRDTTSYANEGGWFDCNMVRFRFGLPEKIGGWTKALASSFQGACRSLHNWVAINGANYLGVGTNLKFYIQEGNSFYDITPNRRTVSLTAAAIATVNTTNTITITDIGHGSIVGDFVTFNGLLAVNGITASNLNIEHQISTVLDSNVYTIIVGGAATSTGTGSGGDAFTATYQINTGLTSSAGGTGWGAGLWGGQVLGGSATTLNGAISSTSSTSNITLSSATGFSSGSSTLSSTIIDTDSSVTIGSATGFPDKGTISIGSEIISYGTLTGDVFTDLTRGAFGTTAAGHTAGDTVTYLGVILIDQELITYTGISTNDLTGISRGTRGTTGATHGDGSLVQDARSFIGWGESSSISVTNEIRLWSQDNYEGDLIFNVRDGAVYVWEEANGLLTRGVDLTSLTGASNVPVVAKQVLTSDRDGHIICFGTNPLGSSTQDPLLVRWSNRDSKVNWDIDASTTAGDMPLGSGSEFVKAVETKRQIIIWTDTAMYSMTFVGAPDTFAFTQISNNTTIVSPNAVGNVDDVLFWMGRETFYMYDGRVRQLPCPIRFKVFGNLNSSRLRTIYAGINSEFTEVIWFYSSSSSQENDSYVVYNYGEQVWYYGSLSRTAWLDRGIRPFPQSTGVESDPYLYNHENGNDNDGTAIDAYVESSQFDIGEGETFSFVDRLIPDVTFSGSTEANPAAIFTIKARNFPGSSYDQSQDNTTTRTSTVPVEQFTNQSFVRVRGRSVALKISSDAVGVQWRLGVPRLNIRSDGRR